MFGGSSVWPMPCRHLSARGLWCEASVLLAECFDKPTALVRFRGAEHCAVEDCELTNSGHTAIRLDLHCRENRVRGNYCHDCSGRYMNAVIRCDDDQHGTLMEGNICCRTGGNGEGFISKGDNDIINNVVADLRPAHRHRGYILFPYGSVRGSTIKHNILYSRRKGQILYYHSRPAGRHGEPPPRLSDTQTDHNLYFCSEDADWAKSHFDTQRPLGIDRSSLSADPLLVDPDAGDFRFRPNSPAAALGIRPLDAGKAGLESPYRQRFCDPPQR